MRVGLAKRIHDEEEEIGAESLENEINQSINVCLLFY